MPATTPEALLKKKRNRKSKTDQTREIKIEQLGGHPIDVTYGLPLSEETRQERVEYLFYLQQPQLIVKFCQECKCPVWNRKGFNKYCSDKCTEKAIERQNEENKERQRQAYREYGKKKVRDYRRQDGPYRGSFWMRKLSGVRTRATKNNLPFDLTCEYLESIWTDTCPVTGRVFVIGDPKDAPSLDRLIPEKGYVKGNVAWISRRANTIKNDASLEDLEMIVRWLKTTEPHREP